MRQLTISTQSFSFSPTSGGGSGGSGSGLLSSLSHLLLSFLLLNLFQFQSTLAQPTLFPYGPSQADLTLPRDIDDCASPEFRLQTPIVFYGQQYSSIYVSMVYFHSCLKLPKKIIIRQKVALYSNNKNNKNFFDFF